MLRLLLSRLLPCYHGYNICRCCLCQCSWLSLLLLLLPPPPSLFPPLLLLLLLLLPPLLPPPLLLSLRLRPMLSLHLLLPL